MTQGSLLAAGRPCMTALKKRERAILVSSVEVVGDLIIIK